MRFNNARDVLKAYWDNFLPVDPIKIARMMGVQVKADSFLDHSGHFQFDDGRPVITYNSYEPNKRSRFTIAHELGHFVLGDVNAPRDTDYSFATGNYDPREVAANRFAAELLMPEHAINYLLYTKGIRKIEDLSQKFGVSTGAMHYRLLNLGML